MNIPLTPLRILSYARAQFPNRTAVVCGEQRFTYRQFAQRVARFAGALRAMGLEEGDRVAILSSNCHKFLEAYYAVPEAGGILVPLNTRLSPRELTYIIGDARPAILLLERTYLYVMMSVLESQMSKPRMILLDGPRSSVFGDYEQLLAAAEPYQRDVMTVDEDSTAEVFYTSGTTSNPRGVMLSHRNIYLHAMNHCMTFNPNALVTHLHAIPMFHVNGWGAVQYVLIGAKHVMIRHFQPPEVFRLIEKESVTSIALVPTMATMLLASEDRGKYDLSSLERVRVGGSTPAPSLLRAIEEEIGGTAFNAYGLTECSPSLTSSTVKAGLPNDGEERYRRQAMSGHAINGTTVRVIDMDGNDVPHDGVSVGEVIAQSDGIMTGYWNDPKATSLVLSDGWLSTGDMATMDGEGYLQIVDRKKDIIISGGENISSVELENTIVTHPAVSEVAVVAIADEKWGERPKAFVVLRVGEFASEDELIEHCRRSLAHFKCPKEIEFVAHLPKTGTGKILKRELRDGKV